MCLTSKMLCDTLWILITHVHIDECISDFVQELGFKDDLNDLLEEEPPNDGTHETYQATQEKLSNAKNGGNGSALRRSDLQQPKQLHYTL